MINAQLINEAREEMKRLEKRFKEYEDTVESTRCGGWPLASCGESGAIKRSSMDLSRSLVKLRKPYNTCINK